MRYIYRTQIDVAKGNQNIEITGTIVHIAPARNDFTEAKIDVWHIDNPGNVPFKVGIYIFGTGHPIDDDELVYIGSAVMRQLVWHVFYGPEVENG